MIVPYFLALIANGSLKNRCCHINQISGGRHLVATKVYYLIRMVSISVTQASRGMSCACGKIDSMQENA